MFNPALFLNTGYSYSICGTENTGFKVRIMGKYVGTFAYLEEAHNRILMGFRVYRG